MIISLLYSEKGIWDNKKGDFRMGTTIPHTNGPKGKEPADHHVLVYQELEPELHVELLREPPPYLEEHCARSIRGPKSVRYRYSLEAPFLFFYSNAK